MRKNGILIAVSALILMAGFFLYVDSADGADESDSGTCGDFLVWSYNSSTKTLTITGSGAMYDYDVEERPWQSCHWYVQKLILNEGLTYIGKYAFCGFTILNGAPVLPDSLRTIAEGAFQDCRSINGGTITIPSNVVTIDVNAFWNFYGVNLSIESTKLVTIGNGAFRGCIDASGTITIPSSVKTIGETAFYKCEKLEGISIQSTSVLETIGKSAFEDCVKLSGTVTIPPSVETIGESAFNKCGELTGISIESVSMLETIGNRAFQGCVKLGGTVTIPNIAKTIGDMAFYGCGELKGLTVTSTKLVTIGNNAFEGCVKLGGTITIPSTVETIGEMAFYGCGELSGLTIQSTVLKTIGNKAFEKCPKLSGTLNIPQTVESIGDCAFYMCNKLTGTLAIPASTTYIGTRAFAETGFSAITVNDSNPNYKSQNGILFSKDMKLLIQATIGNTANGYVIPNTVETVGDYAFSECSGFTGALRIPDSVVSIGNNAFSGCSGFTGKNYNYESSVLIIPPNVVSIGNNAFSGCSGFTGDLVIMEGVKSIGEAAFMNCTGFAGTLTLPSTLESIGSSAFYHCEKLSGELKIPGSIKTIEKQTFESCKGFTSLTIGYGITDINEMAFIQCSGFTGDLTIPGSVVNIKGSAFRYCSDFDGTLAIPSSANISGYYTFADNTKFTSAVVGVGATIADTGNFSIQFYDTDGTTVLSDSSLHGYSYKLSGTKMVRHLPVYDVTYNIDSGSEPAPNQIPVEEGGSFTVASYNGTYGAYTFVLWHDGTEYYWPGDTYTVGTDNVVLNAVWCNGKCGDNLYYRIDMSDTRLTIFGTGDMWDFEYDEDKNEGNTPWKDYRTSLKTLVIEEGAESIGANAFCECYNAAGTLSIPSTVTSIGDYAFYDCEELTGLELNEGLEVIGEGAFGDCDLLAGTLSIPSTVTSIGDYAFYECYSLTGTLSIPSTVTTIGYETFYDCEELTGLELNEGLKTISYGAFRDCYKLTGTLSIPSTVTTIGDEAFYWCEGLTGLELKEGLVTIGDEAFYECEKLTGTLSIPSTVTTIGDEAFDWCEGLTKLKLKEGLVTIGYEAFYGCENLAGTLSIPSTVTSIGENAFSYCSSFTGTLSIPSTITSISDGTFSSCSGLTGLDLGDKLQTIGDCAFEDCTGLKGTLNIPSTVTSIGTQAFDNCIGFTGPLTLHEGLVTIGKKAFYNCTGFTGSLVIPSTVTVINEKTFYRCTGLTGPLTLPETLKTIGDGAFMECTGLKGSLVIPSGVETINQDAFKDCTGFTDLILMLESSNIGSNVFNGCTGIQSVYFENELNIDDGVFFGWTFQPGGTSDPTDSAGGYPAYFSGTTDNMVYRGTGHVVYYDISGGDAPAPLPQTVLEDASFSLLPYTGTKAGYVFGGWSDGTKTYQPGDAYVMGTSDITFTAVWTPQYTVSYDVDGGSKSMYDSYVIAGKTFTVPSYSGVKIGNVFVGWSDGSLTYMPGYEIKNVNRDIHLKAVWTGSPCTAHFDLDGGDGNVPSMTLKDGKTFILPSYDGTKAGYTFGGWNDGTKTYQPGDSYTMGSSDVTFKAVWKDKPNHKVSYDVNGGTGSVPQTMVREDSQFMVESYDGTKAGYTFGGWNDGTKTYQPEDSYVMGTADVKFTAVWNENPSHTVSYDVNGGTGSVPSQNVKEDLQFVLAEYSGTKDGYMFMGWNDGTKTYQPGSSYLMGSSNIMFTAVWTTKPSHTVTYDVNGGSQPVPSEVAEEESSFAVPQYSGTKAGYTFAGWNDGLNSYQPGDMYTMGTSDVTFTAVWNENPSHTVSYDVNGGTGSVASETMKEGTEFALASYSGTKTGYTFMGWSDGSRTYQPGDAYIMGTSDVAFKAVWYGSTDHRVSYNLNGGTGSIDTQYYSAGESFKISGKIPEKSGCTFGSWQYNGKTYSPGDSMVMGDSDITFTAVWNEVSKDSNTVYYIIGAAVAAIVVLAVCVVAVRRP